MYVELHAEITLLKEPEFMFLDVEAALNQVYRELHAMRDFCNEEVVMGESIFPAQRSHAKCIRAGLVKRKPKNNSI